jgi:hypothetical protein
MTQKDPRKRLSASEYLKILMGRSGGSAPLPQFLESSVYPLFLKLHWNGVTPDDRIKIVCEV